MEAERTASVETMRLSFLVLKREGQESRVTWFGSTPSESARTGDRLASYQYRSTLLFFVLNNLL